MRVEAIAIRLEAIALRVETLKSVLLTTNVGCQCY